MDRLTDLLVDQICAEIGYRPTFFVDKGGMEWRPRLGMEGRRLKMYWSGFFRGCERCGGHRDWFATDNISFVKSYFYKLPARRSKQKSPLLSFRELVPFYHLRPPRT